MIILIREGKIRGRSGQVIYYIGPYPGIIILIPRKVLSYILKSIFVAVYEGVFELTRGYRLIGQIVALFLRQDDISIRGSVHFAVIGALGLINDAGIILLHLLAQSQLCRYGINVGPCAR